MQKTKLEDYFEKDITIYLVENSKYEYITGRLVGIEKGSVFIYDKDDDENFCIPKQSIVFFSD